MLTSTRRALWLPFTQMQDAVVRRFVSASGSFLRDDAGCTVFDATSSIWTIVHGHGEPAIVDAIARQAAALDHATLLGASNPRAEELAGRLCSLAGLPHAFFASDGASAIEAALKMALNYWRAHGAPERRRFVRLVSAYHGDTLGAMSVSDIGAFKDAYRDVTFETLAYGGHETADVLARPDVAAIVVEPGVQAAAGMRLVDDAAYAPLRARTGGPLLVVDEIATGFGRTGAMFAFEELGLVPDVVCVGKGLSGGVLPLSATLASAEIFDAFLAPSAERRQFFHGHSFAGNPIACAAAIASLEIFERSGTLAHARSLSRSLDAPFARLAAHPRVRDVRKRGLMCGVELRAERFATHERGAAWRVADFLYERGHFTRPILDTIQLVPPLATPADTLLDFCTTLARALDEVT